MEEKANLTDIFDLTFTKFVTPIIIKIAFIVVMVFAGLMWLAVIFAGFASSFWGGIGGIIFGGLRRSPGPPRSVAGLEGRR